MDPATAHDRRWWTLIVLCVSLMVIGLDNTILNVALPTLVRQLHASNSQLQWIVDAYTLVFAGLLLSAGSLGDRFGRQGALNFGLVVFAAGSILAAMASSPGQLIATRALMGVGGAFIMPSTLSILTNVFTEARERRRAIAVWAGIAGLGIATGPIIGGWLLEHFWWGSVFTVNLPVVAVALVAGRFLVPTSRDPAAPRLDPVGAGLSIVGLVALVYGIIEAPIDGWTSPTILGAFGIAVVVLAAFGAWEMHSTHPMLDLHFFRNRRFTAASAVVSLVFFALFGSLFFITQYLQFVLRFSALEAGVRVAPFALMMMAFATQSPRVVERFGTKRTVATGLVVLAVGIGVMATISTGSGYGRVLLSMSIMGAGMGLTMAPATDSIMGALPLAKAGVGSAMNDTTRQVGGALGVAVLGSLLTAGYSSSIGDFLRSHPLPADAIGSVKSSVGAAMEQAARLGGARGGALRAAAGRAFVNATHISLYVGVAVALVGTVIVVLFLPARAEELHEVAEFVEAAPDEAPAPAVA